MVYQRVLSFLSFTGQAPNMLCGVIIVCQCCGYAQHCVPNGVLWYWPEGTQFSGFQTADTKHRAEWCQPPLPVSWVCTALHTLMLGYAMVCTENSVLGFIVQVPNVVLVSFMCVDTCTEYSGCVLRFGRLGYGLRVLTFCPQETGSHLRWSL